MFMVAYLPRYRSNKQMTPQIKILDKTMGKLCIEEYPYLAAANLKTTDASKSWAQDQEKDFHP